MLKYHSAFVLVLYSAYHSSGTSTTPLIKPHHLQRSGAESHVQHSPQETPRFRNYSTPETVEKRIQASLQRALRPVNDTLS
jgi:hypothetical protein